MHMNTQGLKGTTESGNTVIYSEVDQSVAHIHYCYDIIIVIVNARNSRHWIISMYYWLITEHWYVIDCSLYFEYLLAFHPNQ